ncbi:MAG: hypothetical protein OXI34_08340 [Chloroflexota bacterium]|nr:hypothetical protein [Chloroflexota bacterium]MDE2854056.1 hypothetical protein [Chloroflexota bacterium]MDE2948609.1 hypothetical protein [Chloroflexota bacterium]
MPAYDDVALRSISLSAIIVRREESNACSSFHLHNAATLTAGSAIELLLDVLVERLIEKLVIDDPNEAAKISQRRTAMEKRLQSNRVTFFEWIQFYSELNLPQQLREQFGREFAFLDNSRLHRVRTWWNKAKHDHHRVPPPVAAAIVGYMNDALEEADIRTEHGTTEFSFIGLHNISWQQSWNKKINKWVLQNPDSPAADLLVYLPLLLGLIINLIGDSRVPFSQKSSLLVAANYVFSSEDLISESIHNVRGLVDDAAVLFLSLYWLCRDGNLDESIVQENWDNPTDIIGYISKQVKFIRDNHTKLFPDSPHQFGDKLVWATIRRIATDGPEALWQNYWKEAY